MSDLARKLIGESAYAGFRAMELNSDQPMPARAKVIFRSPSQRTAENTALAMRKQYGINLWVDGTVTTGWRVLVHPGDADRASRMAKSVREGVMDMLARKSGAVPDTQKWALQLERGARIGYIRPRIRYVGAERQPDGTVKPGYDVDDIYLSDIVDSPSLYTYEEALAVKRVFLEKYGHVNATLRLVPEASLKLRGK